ncbi:general transcription factor II-I repeat domain-containing protein 2-like [Rhynchonycteris naso]
MRSDSCVSSQIAVRFAQGSVNLKGGRGTGSVIVLVGSHTAPLPFVEGEFVKECLLSVAKEICPEKADLFSTVSLSGSTIARRTEEMGDNLYQHLQNSVRKLSYFSLALDESNDVRDSAQLLIFICGTNANFKVTEELAVLQSIKGTTTGEDIYEKVSQTVKDLELGWAKLAIVTTDGASSMVGSKKGVIAHINQEMDKRNHSHPIAIDCLIHQQALCSRSVKWHSVMKIVVSCVNFIRANALNHRQFQEFLSELNVAYEDVLYHTEVNWLSQGRVLRHFYDLLPQITAFMVSKNKEVPELNDAEWKWHFAFLTDVTELLNSFNVQLQGKGKLICDMQSHVKAFEKRVDSLEKLQKEFQFRFKELHLHEQDIQLFRNPFSIYIENVDTIYQMELAELQNCDSLKDAFKSSSLPNFYVSLPSETYPNLRNHALKMATIFGKKKKAKTNWNFPNLRAALQECFTKGVEDFKVDFFKPRLRDGAAIFTIPFMSSGDITDDMETQMSSYFSTGRDNIWMRYSRDTR